MTKTKFQRGLCVQHGCKNPGTISPNETQHFCQAHWDQIRQIYDRHEQMMQEIQEWAAQRRVQHEVKRKQTTQQNEVQP